MGNSHKNLLLRNHWANCNQTVIPTSNQDGHQAKNRKEGGWNYSSWNAFFYWLTAFGYSNNQREATLLQNVKYENQNFENHWHICFFTAILITYIKGGTPAQFFCRKSLQWRLHLLIFFTEVIKFYWLMLLLYPGELYRLLGASSYASRNPLFRKSW